MSKTYEITTIAYPESMLSKLGMFDGYDYEAVIDQGLFFVPPTEAASLYLEEAPDPMSFHLGDYRKTEVEKILSLLSNHRVVHVDTLSGSGVSEFVFPQIPHSMVFEGYLPTNKNLESCLGSKPRLKNIILDEVYWGEKSRKTPELYADELRELTTSFSGLNFLLSIGTTALTKDSLQILFSGLDVGVARIGRKPFNNVQAWEYVVSKWPNLRYLDDSTTQELKSYLETKKADFANSWHFRWIRRVIDDFTWAFAAKPANGVSYSSVELERIKKDLREGGVIK